METKALLILGVMISVITVGARADSTAPKDRPLKTLQDYKALNPMEMDAFAGDAAKQEQIAELYLSSRAPSKKIDQRAGVHFLLRAATMGNPRSMSRLADALDRGAFGFKKLPQAASCWSGAPSDFEKRLTCLSLTDLRDARARIPCNYFALIQNGLPHSKRNAATMAKLCLANKTPALLVPGPPPGKDAIERWRLYGEKGIELQLTGDVYEEKFERYRNEFNQTTVAGIDAERGRGYMNRLSADIEKRISRGSRANK